LRSERKSKQKEGRQIVNDKRNGQFDSRTENRAWLKCKARPYEIATARAKAATIRDAPGGGCR